MPLFSVDVRVVTIHEVRVWGNNPDEAAATAQRVVEDSDDCTQADRDAVESYQDEERVLVETDAVTFLEDD